MNGFEPAEPGNLPLRLLDPAPIGVSVWQGPEHRLAYTNTAFRTIFGEQPLGATLREAFADLRQREYFTLIDRVFETGEPLYLSQAPVRVDFPHGAAEERFFNVSLSPVPASGEETGEVEGRVRGVLFLAVEVTGEVTASEQVRLISETRRRALHRYESLVAAGSQLVWVTEPGGQIVERSPAWERVTGMSWEEIRGDGWLNSAHPDDRDELTEAWYGAVREMPDTFEHTYRLRQRDGSYRHCQIRAVPVRENGVLVEWVGACTDIEARWIQERRLNLLARASAAVAGAVGVEEAFSNLSRVVVPDLADKCGIYLFVESSEPARGRPWVVNRIAVAAREGLPGKLPPLREERLSADSAFSRAVRDRHPVHASLSPGSVPPQIVPPGTRRWLAEAGAHSMILLPILVDGAVVAVANVFVCGDRPPIGSQEMQLVRELLEQAHDPLSQVLELRRTRRVALALQEYLLTEPPRSGDLQIVARYMSSPTADQVGGDWYDSFRLPDGSTTLIIGDIAGHDVDAAVTMSQLRNMLRALVVDRRDAPGEVLRRLDDCMRLLAPEETTATCVFARIESADDGARQFHYTVAGHPPPLLITAEGQTEFLEEATNALLGVLDPQTARSSAVQPLPAGSTLLLYTDGLVERRDESLEESLQRLREFAAGAVGEPLEQFCDELLTLPSEDSSDDIALIAVRVPG